MKYLLLLGIICISMNSFAQEKIYLWPDGAPMAKSKEDADQPYMMAYNPATKNAQKSAVVICPGGGYGHLADDHEGRWPNGTTTVA
jgi:hypothetical protein